MTKPDNIKIESLIATPEEIIEAINNLTIVEKKRLLHHSSFRLNIISKGYTPNDLINEAITATLEGRRKWPINKVDFFGHLYWVIKSITNNWSKNKNSLEKPSNTLSYEEDSTIDIYGEHSSSLPLPEANIAAKQLLDKIKDLFSDDKVILEIMECWSEGFKGPEIQELLDISQTQYETAVKRLRRKSITRFQSKKVGC